MGTLPHVRNPPIRFVLLDKTNAPDYFKQLSLFLVWCSRTTTRPVSLSEPLGGVKNLQVTDPTTNSLRVRWEPAEGDVRQYQIFYVPTAGGADGVVGLMMELH